MTGAQLPLYVIVHVTTMTSFSFTAPEADKFVKQVVSSSTNNRILRSCIRHNLLLRLLLDRNFNLHCQIRESLHTKCNAIIITTRLTRTSICCHMLIDRSTLAEDMTRNVICNYKTFRLNIITDNNELSALYLLNTVTRDAFDTDVDSGVSELSWVDVEVTCDVCSVVLFGYAEP